MASDGGSNEIKSMVFLILLGVGVFFGYKWYLSNDKDAEYRMKKLETEYKDLQSKKDSSDIKILAWKSKFDSIRVQDTILKHQTVLLAKQTIVAETAAAKSRAELETAKAHSESLRIDINKLEKTPINRTGDDLIQSLKNKLK